MAPLSAGLVLSSKETTVLNFVTHWPPSDTDLTSVSEFHFKRKDSLITPPRALDQPVALGICAQQSTDATEVPHMCNTHGRAHQGLGS